MSITLRVMRFVSGALALFGALSANPCASSAQAAPVSPQDAEFFETSVRPVLFEKCFSCHGEKRQQGDLRLDSREFALKGGGNGPTIMPGDPDNSLLIRAVRYDGGLKMPPAGKLKPTEIAALAQWVKMGAPWPAAASKQPVAPTVPASASSASTHWAFRPMKKSAPPRVKDTAWVKSPIDRFILARLEAKSLSPAPAADRRTLIRRAAFDLTGLPPTAEEVDAFLKDRSANAFEKVIDSLLASPAYGERWGRHWLDVARYADTKGYVFTEDAVYHNAYTYRDWVIRSLNEDLPYDQFVIRQLAADQLHEQDRRSLAALGFLTVGRRFLNDPVFINDDRIDVTTRGLMGLTVGCARCHNHKFDPITAKDYYALYGVFASSVEPTPPPAISPREISEPYEKHNALLRQIQEEHDNLVRDQVNALRARVEKAPETVSTQIKQTLQSIRPEVLPNGDQIRTLAAEFKPTAQQRLKELSQTRADLDKKTPPTPEFAMGFVDAPQPFDPYVFVRGNPNNRGESVKRRFLTCLAGENPQPFRIGSGRLELAQAIADKDNPLTARVFVNRVWMYHFGQALVRTPGDFGTRGEPPTHPELLDWLALRFIENGWSLKRLHKTIMLSSSYQQSSLGTAKAFLADPENRLLSHQNRQRLDLEALRDSLLWASGRLDTKVGGPAVEITMPPYSTRKTVYGFIDRQNLQGLFRTFDFASPDASSAQRYRTTVPQQALYMMNSPFLVEQAKALAARPEFAVGAAPAAKVRTAYRLLFSRAPTPEELAAAVSFLKAGASTQLAADRAPKLSRWEEFCQALLITNEFCFVD